MEASLRPRRRARNNQCISGSAWARRLHSTAMPESSIEPPKKAVLAAMSEIQRQHDAREMSTEQAHRDAAAALLAFIDDLVEVTRAFEAIERWYA